MYDAMSLLPPKYTDLAANGTATFVRQGREVLLLRHGYFNEDGPWKDLMPLCSAWLCRCIRLRGTACCRASLCMYCTCSAVRCCYVLLHLLHTDHHTMTSPGIAERPQDPSHPKVFLYVAKALPENVAF